MGKRGQIYILAAILLAVVVYGLSTVVNVVQQEEIRGDFGALSSNYEMESSKLINSVLQDEGNVSDAFNNFTFFFTSYSKAKSPNFHIFYALAYKGDIYFGNFMNEDLYIYTSCPTEFGSCPSSSKLPGCLGNVSAQISFEGLTINPEYVLGEFEKFRGSCFWNTEISGVMDYCVGIGGNMYKLPVKENVPTIFSLSRLKSGAQVLNSVRGEVSEEQVCAGKSSEGSCNSCSAVCCWSEDECEEGSCVVCVEDWVCTDFGSCVGGQRTRTCTDENDCGTTVSQPPESEACCEEDWQCGAWGSCVGGTQTRTCTDSANCGTTVNKPATTQSCV
ncbi:MAG: hypothetical protein Q8N77_00795, partial [Nanoarchaeota archaeon]|nr:hypothetical protein [Nanoarchaeota archaeon]